jgi:hypothetical protein
MKSIQAAIVVFLAYGFSCGQTLILNTNGDTTDTILVTIFSDYPELIPIVNDYKLYEYKKYEPPSSYFVKPDCNSALNWLADLKSKMPDDTLGDYVKVWETTPKTKYILVNSKQGGQELIVLKPDTIEWLYGENYEVSTFLTPSGVYIWSLIFEKNGDITDLGYGLSSYARNPDTSSTSLTKYISIKRNIYSVSSQKYWEKTGILRYEYEFKSYRDYLKHKPFFMYEYNKNGNEIKRKQLYDNEN